MKPKLDVSLTDFIYAVVVGSAFQRIDAPIWSLPNLLLLISFVVILDDWVLYHVQADRIELTSSSDSSVQFAKTLAIDASVLLLWYCAAVAGSKMLMFEFYIFLSLFYFATLLWDLAFLKATKNHGGMLPDATCAVIFLIGAFTHSVPWYPLLAAAFAVVWFASRAHAWKMLVFARA